MILAECVYHMFILQILNIRCDSCLFVCLLFFVCLFVLRSNYLLLHSTLLLGSVFFLRSLSPSWLPSVKSLLLHPAKLLVHFVISEQD